MFCELYVADPVPTSTHPAAVCFALVGTQQSMGVCVRAPTGVPHTCTESDGASATRVQLQAQHEDGRRVCGLQQLGED